MSNLNQAAFVAALLPLAARPRVDELLAGHKIPPEASASDADRLAALAKASGAKSQGDASVLALNVAGAGLKPEDLTRLLAAGFPGSRIGSRHGPHYLSLARTGKLPGVLVGVVPTAKKLAKSVGKAPALPVVLTPAPAVATAALASQPPAPEEASAAIVEDAVDPLPTAASNESLEDSAVQDVIAEGTAASEVAEGDGSPAGLLRAKLLALGQKELAAEAKKVGVKATGKKGDIVERIITAS